MVALMVAVTVAVLLLAVLVAGLLRSHADILRALHSLGAGVGDPTAAGSATDGAATPGPVPVPLGMGPPMPPERSSTGAPTIAGHTPGGDAVALSVATTGHLTLLAFLSSGCASCQTFWQALGSRLDLPPELGEEVRVQIVTKGPELEVPAEVAARAGGARVVMSTEAWSDYEVPGAPFFALVDGGRGRRIGEGVTNQVPQLLDLVRRAVLERNGTSLAPSAAGGPPGGAVAGAVAETGPQRELSNDQALAAAGIFPGDPSLYPGSLDDLYGRNHGARRSEPPTPAEAPTPATTAEGPS